MEQSKKKYTEAVNYGKKIPVTKTSFHYLVANLYRLSLVCEALGEQDETLRHLREAKRFAKVGGFYRNWILLVVLLKLRKKCEEMGSLNKSDQYLREAECVAENLYLDDVSTIVETLKEAGKDISKQVPALVKLGEWYLDKAKTTTNANDFTKAGALLNAALVRSRHVRHEIDEDQVLGKIVEAYRKFLAMFAKADCDGMSADEIRNEIDSHKEWLARQREILKEQLDRNSEMEQEDEVLMFITIILFIINIVYTNNDCISISHVSLHSLLSISCICIRKVSCSFRPSIMLNLEIEIVFRSRNILNAQRVLAMSRE